MNDDTDSLLRRRLIERISKMDVAELRATLAVYLRPGALAQCRTAQDEAAIEAEFRRAVELFSTRPN